MLTTPGVGLKPTILLRAAGTRPEPPVSLPSETLTSPVATPIAEPELEPPGIREGSNALTGWTGDRTPTRPVANWSIVDLPIKIAPAACMRSTAVALREGKWENARHPAVVGNPAT